MLLTFCGFEKQSSQVSTTRLIEWEVYSSRLALAVIQKAPRFATCRLQMIACIARYVHSNVGRANAPWSYTADTLLRISPLKNTWHVADENSEVAPSSLQKAQRICGELPKLEALLA